MDIVIPFRNSINNDEELRYALRSADKYIPQHGNVFIFGDKPAWPHRDLEFIYFRDKYGSWQKDGNIARKLLAACEHLGVSDDFIILHDDNFLLKPFDGQTYYHKGHVWDGRGYYAETEDNTLARFGDYINNYDLHAPHAVNKKLFIKSVGVLDWVKPYGYCIKTAYAVMNGIKGEYHPDRKLTLTDEYDLQDSTFFSCSDEAWRIHKQFVHNLYPEPSKYEKV